MNKFYFIKKDLQQYPKPPFYPDMNYPEFNSVFSKFDEKNQIYSMIRKLLIEANYDNQNVGTKYWNPFRGLIKDGQIVVIKPNLVMEEKEDLIGKNCITIHPSIIRPYFRLFILITKN